MNDFERELYRIVECVVGCCATQVNGNGEMSVTVGDVLGKSRAENVLMARCILVGEIVVAGYSVTTAAQLLRRTPQAIRHLQELGYRYRRSSRAYRIAEAEAALLCRKADPDACGGG